MKSEYTFLKSLLAALHTPIFGKLRADMMIAGRLEEIEREEEEMGNDLSKSHKLDPEYAWDAYKETHP